MAYPKRHPGTSFQPDRLKNKRDQLLILIVQKLKAKLNLNPEEESIAKDKIKFLFMARNSPTEADLKEVER